MVAEENLRNLRMTCRIRGRSPTSSRTPTGVHETARGKKLGLALLYHSLIAMKAQGYAYAIIGSAGPVDFYANAVGAVPIAADKEDIYQGLLRINPLPGPDTLMGKI